MRGVATDTRKGRSHAIPSHLVRLYPSVVMRLPANQILNRNLTASIGALVVKLEVRPIAPGDHLEIRVVSASSDWRQGIWLGVDGQL